MILASINFSIKWKWLKWFIDFTEVERLVRQSINNAVSFSECSSLIIQGTECRVSVIFVPVSDHLVVLFTATSIGIPFGVGASEDNILRISDSEIVFLPEWLWTFNSIFFSILWTLKEEKMPHRLHSLCRMHLQQLPSYDRELLQETSEMFISSK